MLELLKPINLGPISLKNRIVMAAMTRSRADRNGVVGEMTARYYAQRAGAGLIISEAINISEQAIGSPHTPGLYTAEQVEAWKKVTASVHAKGGVIFAQLWHTGRVGHSVDRKGELPVAPSAIAIPQGQHHTSRGVQPYETPRALSVPEIKSIVRDYAQAARNALEAGFDGVELHGANGYLPNQFLAESANQRTDEYGGSVENRSRFILEVIDELIAVAGHERVGVKLSPLHCYAGIALADPVSTFTYLIGEINKRNLLFVELKRRSPLYPAPVHYPTQDEISLFGSLSQVTVIANSGYNRVTAEQELDRGIARMVSFGTPFIANPDLPERFALNAPLAPSDQKTWYVGGEKGYTDYPFLEPVKEVTGQII